MNFEKHLDLAGRHSFLSASSYHWVNYDNDKLVTTFQNRLAAQKGTEIHDLAFQLIRQNVKLPRTKQTLNMYVNDAIGYRMTPEQILFYSNNAFGTADALSFRNGLLRIHDLKTGVTPSSMTQLEVYAAYFCLEYKFKPSTIKMELRLYQNDDVAVHFPELDSIVHIMDKIVTFDKLIDDLLIEDMS